MDYQGYKLIDEIMLVCRDFAKQEDCLCGSTDVYQAYLVDPSNKKQLEAARNWAKWTERKWSRETQSYEYNLEHEPVEFTFENKDFTLELKDCAGGSSQGGKLSFWNCIVTKDNKQFMIGINSDMLLDLLKNATFEKGVCKEPLVFITQKGKVGMTIVGSDAYNQCLKDKELKDTVKSKSTTKYSFGDLINTATLSEIYLGQLTKYYDFDLGDHGGWGYGSRHFEPGRCTLTKLKEPITYQLSEGISKYHKFEKLSDVVKYYNESRYAAPSMVEKRPKRIVTGKLELDMTEEEFYQALMSKAYGMEDFLEKYRKDYARWPVAEEKMFCSFLDTRLFGFGIEPFELDEKIMKLVKHYGIRYVDETEQA